MVHIFNRFIYLTLIVSSVSFAQQWEQMAHFEEGPVASMFFFNEFNGLVGIGSVWGTPAKGIILRTNDGGKSWTKCATPPASIGSIGGVFDIYMTDTIHGWAAVWDENASLWETDDGGRTWNIVKACSGNHGNSVRKTLTTLIKSDLNELPQRSTDNGLTFESIDVNITSDGTLGIDFVDDNHGVMTRYRNGGKWERTTDGGMTWLATEQAVEAWGVYAVRGTSIFYTCEEGNSDLPNSQRYSKIRRSEDYGESWNTIAELPFLSTGAITGINEELFIQTDEERTVSPGLYYSKDRGVSWQHLGGPKTKGDRRFAALRSGCGNGFTIFAADDFGNIFRLRTQGNKAGYVFPVNFGRITATKGSYVEVPVHSIVSTPLDLDSMVFLEFSVTITYDTASLFFDTNSPFSAYVPPMVG